MVQASCVVAIMVRVPAALFALPMTREQTRVYRQCTGRSRAADAPRAAEAWLVFGRRGGKSFVLALIAVYLACFHDYRRHLAPGERGTVIVIAHHRRQARVIFRYISALLTQRPDAREDDRARVSARLRPHQLHDD